MQAAARPFVQLTEHEEQMRARLAAARARAEAEEARELADARRFRALPVPPTTHAPDSEYAAQLRRERERPARVASHARALSATASLPPRMAIAGRTFTSVE
jgi:hypothetical protein